MVLHDDNSVSTITRLSGLSGSVITCVAYDVTSQRLLIGFEDGNLDILSESGMYNFDRIRTSPDITGSRRINHIITRANLAYLATDFGVVVFDLNLREIRETWRDLGADGTKVGVNQSAFVADSIFLATTRGIQAGKLSDNLLDFALWKRYDTGDFSGPVKGVHSVGSFMYACVNTKGLYSYQPGVWTKEVHASGEIFRSLAGSDRLVITTENGVSTYDGNVFDDVVSTQITDAQYATQNADGTLLIGDAQNGLLSEVQGSFVRRIPDGPARQVITQVEFTGGKLYALSGGFQPNMMPANRLGDVNIFEAGQWSILRSPMDDLTDIAFGNTTPYISSYGDGVQEGDIESPSKIHTNLNSTLESTAAGVAVTSLTYTSDGLWVTNYGATNPLHRYANGSWEDFSFGFTASRYPLESIADGLENIWMILNPAQGGGILVFNSDNEQSAYLTNVAGAGGLPNKNVRSLALDRSGYMWVGTDEGVGYYANPSAVFGNSTNLIRPIFESRYLLQTERVTALCVDGGDRKWMGTENGLWLFGPTGEELIHNFTMANSPLPSNRILDLAIDKNTGEVFIATDKGLASYRSDATEGSDFSSVKIYPNPVLPNFAGLVGIAGLSEDAFVKVTDASGRLVYQTQANGGTASWHVRDLQGRRVTTGVYLVFSTSADGIESYVGKIAVVE
jgi:hypothetical protein